MKSPTLLALVVLATTLLGTSLRADEEFDPLASQLVDRAVVMKLPDGVRRVRLRIRKDDGTWKTQTVAHLEGNEGYLKLRLPDGVTEENCEVTASWTDPFPYRVYQGATDHEGTDSEGLVRASPTAGPEQFAGDVVDAEGEPAVEESDIWKWRGSTLYFFNQYRGLQVIDVSDPAAPTRLASHRVDSYGEKMYLHPEEDLVILLTYDSSTGNGRVDLVAHELTHVLQQRASFPVAGYILESRLVGNILYVVSRNSWQETNTDADGTVHVAWRSGLAVTKIDLDDPDNPVASPPLTLSSDRYNYWGAQVQATSKALLVSTNAYDQVSRQSLSTIHVIDISDPAATPRVTHHLPVAGQVLNKFNMNLKGEILTVVSQVWRGTATRRRYASVETFNLYRGSNPRLGDLAFANNESITATRFVGDLLYVVTFFRIDPLFVIDLAQPARPRILSELEIPGFSTYLAPLGEDTLISIGVEGSQIAVSWFDVSDPTNTSLASRVFIGAEDGWSWTEANWDEKALGFFPDDSLLLVPYQGSVPGKGWTSGVQLVELGDKELIKRGNFEHEFRARRARVLGDAVVSISGRSLRSLDITDRDNPRLLSELTLAWPADIVHRVGDTLIQLERGPGYWWHGTPESPARLHVSPVADPDELLKSIELPGGRVAGSFLHGDCLFVAQTQMSSEQIGEELIYSDSFTTTVIDLGDPDRPIIVGRVSKTSKEPSTRYGFGANYRGALLPEGSLVWYPSEQNRFFFGPSPLVDQAVAGDMFFPWFPTSGRVYTVDIADKTQPAILAAVDLTSDNDSWPEGEIRLLGARLYHGLQATDTIAQPDGSIKWISRHWLGHLDLSDPANPGTGDLVKLPGTFEHALATPARGTVLFTSSQRHVEIPDRTWINEFHVQALAFDGVDAFLIEELIVPDWRYGPKVFADRFFVLGKADYSTAEVTTELSIYEWMNNGSFQDLQTLSRSGSVYRLGIKDDLLITIGSNLSFIDFTDPAEPDPAVVSFPATSFWQGVDLIEVHERSSAHLPLGFYGVGNLDFEGAFGAGRAPSPLPAEDAEAEWQTVPLTSLTSTSSSTGLLLGALADGTDWMADWITLDYESWTRQSLGLAPTDAVPSFFADTDSDGTSNGWEYFTGTDPGDPGKVSHLDITITTEPDGERYLTGTLPLNPSAASSERIRAEASFDLENWVDTPGTIELMIHPFSTEIVFRLAKSLKDHESAFLRVTMADGKN